jgi:hypothetical protein
MRRLTNSLQDFLVRHSWGPAVAPRLLKLAVEAQRDAAYKANGQLLEVNRQLAQLKQSYQRLYKDHQNLIGEFRMSSSDASEWRVQIVTITCIVLWKGGLVH